MNQQENNQQFNRKMGKDHKKVAYTERNTMAFQPREDPQSHLKSSVNQNSNEIQFLTHQVDRDQTVT